MNKNFQFYLCIVLAIFMTSCKSKSKLQQTNKQETENIDPSEIKSTFSFSDSDTSQIIILDDELADAIVVASIQKMECYGNCPVFEAKIFSNGLVLFDGKKNTSRIGLYEAYMLKSQIDSIMTQAENIDFFNLNASYPLDGKKLHELPSTIFYVKQDEREREVLNNHGAPKPLKIYESMFLNMLDRLDWRPVAELD